MEMGEFDADVIGSSRMVAVILTQSWCFEWAIMNRWLDRLVKREEPRDIQLDVYQLVYDREPYFREFLDFKERNFQNYHVPYVRYYNDGRLIGQSNFVRPERFLSYFGESSRPPKSE